MSPPLQDVVGILSSRRASKTPKFASANATKDLQKWVDHDALLKALPERAAC